MSAYHHGSLPAALRAATADLIAEKGPSGFSLREVARRAGVSHAAPAHHFGDAEGMLTSLATEGFATLADALTAATDGIDDATERLARIGAAYGRTAAEHPGHRALMERPDLVDTTDAALAAERARVDATMERAVTMLRDQHNPGLDVEVAKIFCWTAIRGLTSPLGGDHDRDLAPAFASFIVYGLASPRAAADR